MNPRLSAALFAACLTLPFGLAQAQEAKGVPTVVLVDQSLADLHYLAPKLDVRYIRATDVYIPQTDYSTAGIVGGALGASLGAAIANAEARKAAQRQADKVLDPMMEPMGKSGLQGPLRQALAEALPVHGMDQTTLLFTGGAKLDHRQFARIPAAKTAERLVLVGYSGDLNDLLMMPVAMHDSLRQLRLALDIEVREGNAQRNRRLFKRDVTWFSQPLAVPEGAEPLDVLGADGQAGLRREIAAAVAATLAMAHEEREFPDVDKDAELGVVNELGLTEFEGVLLDQSQGRALIWTRGGSYVSIPAAQVVTGTDLVAARETETARRSPPDAAAKDGEAADAAGKADAAAAPEAAPEA
jgi:hypothetical protein